MKDKAHEGDEWSVTGTVTRLTTAPKGEIDGVELDDGTILHWPPHLEGYFSAVAKVGGRVKAVGEEKKKHGAKLEVSIVTDLASGESRSRDDAPPHHPGGRREHRLRALEEKVEALTAEVERLGGKV